MLNKELTYRLPSDSRGKIKYLCNLLNLNEAIISQVSEESACQLLGGIVLYHHLPRGAERASVLRDIHSAPGPMRAQLMSKVTDPLVNPLWGVWSLKSEELFAHYDYFDAVSSIGSHLGVSFSAAAGVDTIKKLRNGNFQRPAFRNLLITALVWGFFWNNEGAKNKIKEEIFRRAGKVS
ncbi:hypothetical protein [Marinobacter sp.]|uniref:hypothetical protein n=1 Tax=Marinobacter sp. TaxID=50741 RepID=UPI003A8F4935